LCYVDGGGGGWVVRKKVIDQMNSNRETVVEKDVHGRKGS